MDCYQSVYGMEYLCNRNHVYSEIIISSDGKKAYIPNIFYTDLFGKDLYIEGNVDADGTIEIGYQNLITYQNMPFYVGNVDITTGDIDKEGTFKLYYDAQNKMYYSDQESYFALYLEDGGSYYLDTYFTYFTFIPDNVYPEATKHSYSFVDIDEKAQTTTVDMIDIGDNYFYINNLMPGYDNVWLMGYIDNNGMNIYSYQVASDNCAFCFIDQQGNLLDGGTLAYDSSDKTYKLPSDMMFADVFYDDGSLTGAEGLYVATNNLSNMCISSTTAGINKVENGNENVVSTNYYDLSGRRINNASKGISIKVMKYADGTSKAVKVIK